MRRRRLHARRRRRARRRRGSSTSRRRSATAATRASPTSAATTHAARRPRLRVPPRQHQRPGVGGLRVPARGPQPQPGRAHARDPRGRPRRAGRRHARELHVDVRAAAGGRRAEVVHRHRSPRPRRGRSTRCSRSTPTSPTSPSSARSTCEPWENCGFETVAHMDQGGFEWGLEETEVGLHTFSRARHRLRGQRRPAGDLHVAAARRRDAASPPAPASRPAPRASRRPAARSRAPTATIDFEANVADATFECSLDLEPFDAVHARRSPTPACCRATTCCASSRPTRNRRRRARGRGLRVGGPRAVRRHAARDRRSSARRPTAAARRSSSSAAPTTRRRRRCSRSSAASTARTSSTGRSARARTTCSTTTRTRDFQLAPGPHTLRGARDRRVRAAGPGPEQPGLRGQRRPDAGPLRRGRRRADTIAARHRHHRRPERPDRRDRGDVRVLRHRQRDARRTWSTFECSLDGAPFEACTSPETFTLEPGTHTLPRSARSTSPATSTRRPPSARGTIVAAPVATITSGPSGRILPGQQGPPAPSTRGARDLHVHRRPARRDVRVLARRRRLRALHVAVRGVRVVDDGDHEFEVRGVSAPRPSTASRSSRSRRRATSGAPCSAPTRRGRTRRSPPARPPRRSTRSRRSQFTGSDNRTPPALIDVRVLARRPAVHVAASRPSSSPT